MLLDLSVSNDTLVTVALVLGIIALAVLLLRWLAGRAWRRR
jgi:hypothetical protein